MQTEVGGTALLLVEGNSFGSRHKLVEPGRALEAQLAWGAARTSRSPRHQTCHTYMFNGFVKLIYWLTDLVARAADSNGDNACSVSGMRAVSRSPVFIAKAFEVNQSLMVKKPNRDRNFGVAGEVHTSETWRHETHPRHVRIFRNGVRHVIAGWYGSARRRNFTCVDCTITICTSPT